MGPPTAVVFIRANASNYYHNQMKILCEQRGHDVSQPVGKSQYYTKLMGGFIFETGFCVSQTDLKFPKQQRVTLNFLSSCLYLLNTRIIGMSHHTLYIVPRTKPRTSHMPGKHLLTEVGFPALSLPSPG